MVYRCIDRFPRRMAILALAIGCLMLGPALSEEENGETSPQEWTETDTRLANHYLNLLQKKPEFGNVLNLLWDLYEKKNQTPLLLDYLKTSASQTGAHLPKLIYAHLLRKSGDTDSAIPFYRSVVEAVPDETNALKALAEFAERDQKPVQAISYYNRLVALLPPDEEHGVTVRLRKANLHQSINQTSRAVALWKELLASRPGDEDLRKEVVGMMLEAGETSDAITVLEQQTQSGQVATRLAALSELERVYGLINDFANAARVSREAMKVLHFRNHQHRDFFERLVRTYEKFDRLDRLENELTERISDRNPSEASLYNLAAFYQLTADPLGEEELVQRLVERLPNQIDYRIRLARLQLSNDRFDKAAQTLDRVLAEQESVPLNLILLRVQIDLNAEDEVSAEKRLLDYLESNRGDRELREKIIDFARTNYLDGLVESLLRESAEGALTGSDGASAPLALARFLSERGRFDKAEKVIARFVNEAEGSETEKTQRLHQAALAYRELDLIDEAERSIDLALDSEPDNTDFLETKSGLQVDRGEYRDAIATLERIWELESDLESKTVVDQKIFSLLRAHSSEPPAPSPSTLPSGPITSVEQYRRMAQSISASSRRQADEAPPEELIDYYEDLLKTANRSRRLADRYRAGWWAFKLQKFSDCLFHLQAAKAESPGETIVEVEELLLEYAEQNEKYGAMVRHLEELARKDLANSEDYWRRWAEVKFLLGFEDTAIRKLKQMAAQPDASLQTLTSLAKLYGEQGSSQKQIEVWESAYRSANLFDKRRIVRQLTSTLVALNQPQAALQAQMKLIEKENDLIQKRKQFENQLTVANRNYLLDWLKDRYVEAAQQWPLDRFFPEALGEIYQALDRPVEAFQAFKKAHYMSGEDSELLGQLVQLANRLGETQSAIYYSRQMISRSQGEQNRENWENLIEMLENDFRISEAELIRKRIEVKFGHDPDFLRIQGGFYRDQGRLEDAVRLYQKRTRLRDWDIQARFDLALAQLESGSREAAAVHLITILEKTEDEPIPDWGRSGLWPLISSGESLDDLNLELQTFPYLAPSVEDEFALWSEERSHPEFEYRPVEKYAIRLRAIEELSRLVSSLPEYSGWLSEWLARDQPDHEKWWAARHSASPEAIEFIYSSQLEDEPSPLEVYTLADGLLGSGRRDLLEQWIGDSPYHEESGLSRRAAVTFAIHHSLKNGESVPLDLAGGLLAFISPPTAVASHIIMQLKKDGLFGEAAFCGEAMAGDHSVQRGSEFLYALSRIHDQLGNFSRQEVKLDLALAQSGDLNPPAFLDRYHLSTSIEEKDELIGFLEARFVALSGQDATTRVHARSLSNFLRGRHAAAMADLKDLPGLLLTSAEAAPPLFRARISSPWERLGEELAFYSQWIPLKVRKSHSLATAFGDRFFSYPGNVEWLHDFEEFESRRFVEYLTGKPAMDRSVAVDEVLPLIQTMDGRLDLARLLEKFGYHREAARIFRHEVTSGSEDYAALRGLFRTSDMAMDPGPALEIIERLESGEIPSPPGVTVGYINQYHARFLWHARNLVCLEQLALLHDHEIGGPIRTTQHLPFQDEMVQALHYSGGDTELLSLLSRMKRRREADKSQILLGAELLMRRGDHDEALRWLDAIERNQSDPESELRAMHLYFEVFSQKSPLDKRSLKWLARGALSYRDAELIEKVADHFLTKGEGEAAISLLKLSCRQEWNDRQQAAILSAVAQHRPADLNRELRIYLNRMGNSIGAGERLVDWVVHHRDHLAEDLDAFDGHPSPLSRLVGAWLRGRLETALADLRGETADRDYESILLYLARFGDEGRALAKAEVERMGKPGPHFFSGQPERQFRFFSAIGDRIRLLECHSAMMRLAGTFYFTRNWVRPPYESLDRHWHLPAVMEELGHDDLAASLFAAFYESIRHHREAYIPFVNSHLDHLIRSGRFERAEQVILEMARYRPGFDLRKIVTLYDKWGRIDEVDTLIARFDLTRGQKSMLDDWISSLAEGREMVEYCRPH